MYVLVCDRDRESLLFYTIEEECIIQADFRISAKDEAARLADHAFGAPILHVIGCAGLGFCSKPWTIVHVHERNQKAITTFGAMILHVIGRAGRGD